MCVVDKQSDSVLTIHLDTAPHLKRTFHITTQDGMLFFSKAFIGIGTPRAEEKQRQLQFGYKGTAFLE